MGRLIDIDRLCNDFMIHCKNIADKKKEDLIRAVMADVVTPIVVSQPTVDAVRVVRCRDCKSFSHGYCRFHDAKFVRPDGYCYWGERKDGDHEKAD